ncbi:hypothetical protein, partial [Frankia sp. Cr2]|uniref:hypothetical protein n=1 Tax=Frankia sp. Cr2 TaxID=3073932 RepID=UPI002AD27D60
MYVVSESEQVNPGQAAILPAGVVRQLKAVDRTACRPGPERDVGDVGHGEGRHGAVRRGASVVGS